VIGTSVPEAATDKAEMLLEPKLDTYTVFPLGVTAIPEISIPAPVGNGEPATCESAPVPAVIEKTETSEEPELATKRNLPTESTATGEGDLPGIKGDPAIGLRVPESTAIVNAECVWPLDSQRTGNVRRDRWSAHSIRPPLKRERRLEESTFLWNCLWNRRRPCRFPIG